MPQRPRRPLALAAVLQRLVLLQLFLPLVALTTLGIGGAGYLAERTVEGRQRQRAQFIARLVDRYLDQAARTLDAAARVAETAPRAELTAMQGTWEAYGYFDTLYRLDGGGRIESLVPPDPRYQGLDLSNLPSFRQGADARSLTISRPFISVRTGNPTVYLVRRLAGGGNLVGELSLDALQGEIAGGPGPGEDVVFILDQSGTLIAHPSPHLVREQANQGALEIFRRGLEGDVTLLYGYAGTTVLGSAVRVERAGWVVVDQAPLWGSLRPYAGALGLTVLASVAIWLALAWSLRHQLAQHVALPLAQLSRGTGALARGDFGTGKALAAVPAAFAEVTMLASDFLHMSDALEGRQAALQESEERYRSLFERMPVALFRTTPEGRYLDVNLAYVALLGFPDREALMRIAATELYVEPRVRERWRAIADRDGVVQDFEMQLRRRDGTLLWVRHHGRAVRDHEGRVLYYEGSLVDITERKRAEEEVRRLNQDLERRVAERTAQLEAANKELEAFAYSVSHDLRAPVRHIDGFLERLRGRLGDGLDPQARHYMDAVTEAARRMGALIDDLLAFSRMGRQEMSRQPVDLAHLVQDVIRELAPETAGRDVRFRVDALPVVAGDRAMLQVALANLLSNAVKFTRPRAHAEIHVGREPGDGDEVVVFVRDNGVGFDMAYVHKLFGVFQRLHGMDEFEGTGIGLASVRRIVLRHGGRTWAEGAVGAGAKFCISLPRVVAAGAAGRREGAA